MARITVIGRIDNVRFQKAKSISESLQSASLIGVDIQSHFESSLESSLKSLTETYEIQNLKDLNLLIIIDNTYIGTLEDLETWAFQHYHYFDNNPRSFYEFQAKEHTSRYFMQSENIYVELMISINHHQKPILFELFTKTCPKSCKEFLELALNAKRSSNGDILGYKGSTFNRVVQGCYVMGGFSPKLNESHTENINQECFEIKHDREGLLGLSKRGLFYVTMRALPHLDQKYIIIGRVIKGMDLIREISSLESSYQHLVVPPVIGQANILPLDHDIIRSDVNLLHFYSKNISKFIPNHTIKLQKIGKKPITDEANEMATQRSVLNDIQKPKQGERKTKIVCTLGPSTSEVSTMKKLIEAGMNCARLNLAHGNKQMHEDLIKNIKQACLLTNEDVAIILELKGPQMRTGLHRNSQKIDLKIGQELEITTDYAYLGDSHKISISNRDVVSCLSLGNTILISDGSIICEVTQILEGSFKVKIISASVSLLERQNISILGVRINSPSNNETDIQLLLELSIPNHVDFVAITAHSSQDIKNIRAKLGNNGKFIKILAKIENITGLENTEDILKETDGLIIERGDLGMDLPHEKVFLAQKYIISLANLYGKPVLTCSQMLDSMIKNPRPTRAEASDVANAIIDGTDGVMLSSETAIGSFPIEALNFMGKICLEAEKFVETKGSKDWEIIAGIRESTCKAAADLANQRDVKVVIVISDRGGTARLVEKYKPRSPIFVISNNEATIRQLNFYRNLWGIKIAEYGPLNSMLAVAFEEIKQKNIAKPGDSAVVVHGNSEKNPTKADVLTYTEII